MKKNERNDFTGDDNGEDEEDKYAVYMKGKSFAEAWEEKKAKDRQRKLEEQRLEQEKKLKDLQKRQSHLLKLQQQRLDIAKTKAEIKKTKASIAKMKSEKYRKWGQGAKTVGKAFYDLTKEQKKKEQSRQRKKRRTTSKRRKRTGYYCPKCRKRHSYSSKIGRSHRKYKR